MTKQKLDGRESQRTKTVVAASGNLFEWNEWVCRMNSNIFTKRLPQGGKMIHACDRVNGKHRHHLHV